MPYCSPYMVHTVRPDTFRNLYDTMVDLDGSSQYGIEVKTTSIQEVYQKRCINRSGITDPRRVI